MHFKFLPIKRQVLGQESESVLRKCLYTILCSFVLLLAVSCASAGGGSTSVSSSSSGDVYTVSGTLVGLIPGETVTLQNNGANPIELDENGEFTFTVSLASDAAYSVTVSAQPTLETCTITGGDGTVSAAVTDVAVSCKFTNYIVFKSAAQYDGNLGGKEGADAKCMADVNRLDDSTYNAFIVEDEGDARLVCNDPDCQPGGGEEDWVLKASTSYYRADATTLVFTTDNDKILNFDLNSLTNSFSADTDDAVSLFWTGIASDWRLDSDRNCVDFTSNSSVEEGSYGNSKFINGGGISNGWDGCDVQRNLLCVRQ
jgi:hypothetical protein